MSKCSPFLFLALAANAFGELDPPLHDASYVTARDRVSARADAVARAKNVILLVGDGMSLATVTAARIFQGQQLGLAGEAHLLSFEAFGHTAFAKTWNVDSQVPDSAGTATAMMSGVKTRIGVIGVDASIERGSCEGVEEARVPNLLELAEAAGMRTGIVTTTEITHATPASGYAHVSDRNFDSKSACGTDIPAQLVEFDFGDGIEVALGGGAAMFERRDDGRDLLGEWRERYPQGRLVTTAEALDAADSLPILGLFNDGHMNFEADRAGSSEPSLAHMTRVALDHLDTGEAGFFLLVEGGRIDHAHHFNNAYRALADTLALSDAVAVAIEKTSREDTLIIVTADHGHTMTIGGYPERGNPILGLVRTAEEGLSLDKAGHPFPTLAYANGPGYRAASAPLEQAEALSPDFQQPAAVHLDVETHSGEDVPVYAEGPGANRVRGVMEQNEVFHIMWQALFEDAGEHAQ